MTSKSHRVVPFFIVSAPSLSRIWSKCLLIRKIFVIPILQFFKYILINNIYVCISLYVCLHVYMHTHTQMCVCVTAVIVTLVPGIVPTEGHSLAVRSWRDWHDPHWQKPECDWGRWFHGAGQHEVALDHSKRGYNIIIYYSCSSVLSVETWHRMCFESSFVFVEYSNMQGLMH